MKASLDTNVIIHFYRADCQNILFDFFKEGIIVYEQIRNLELEHHRKDILDRVDADILSGKIQIYTDEKLREQAVFRIFQNNVKENRMLYGPGDLGEVYAISLAQTIGAVSLITDDIKQGGAYMSLLQLQYDIMLFHFAEVLILRYLLGGADVLQTVKDFHRINETSNLQWSLKSQTAKFIKRFWKDPYRNDEKVWMNILVEEKHIHVKSKFAALQKLL